MADDWLKSVARIIVWKDTHNLLVISDSLIVVSQDFTRLVVSQDSHRIPSMLLWESRCGYPEKQQASMLVLLRLLRSQLKHNLLTIDGDCWHIHPAAQLYILWANPCNDRN